ncbi:hypothetical protein ACFWBV_34085 [Streptomyces sp. NPDC060030]|uniref:hypothetical protein n=1 Tax=Streptomyces sp. NPDC060030 TaxID=3347042 RepID=UPI0036A2C6B9
MFFRLISTSPSAIPPELLKARSAVRQMSPYGALAEGEAAACASPPPGPSAFRDPVEALEPSVPPVPEGAPVGAFADADADADADAEASTDPEAADADAATSVPVPFPLVQAVSDRAATAAAAMTTRVF